MTTTATALRRISRIRTWPCAALLPALLILAPAAEAQERPAARSAPGAAAPRHDPVPERARDSVRQAVDYLLRAQNRDGSWGDDHGSPGDLGNTAIGALALLADGSTPTRGPHALALRRAIDWIARRTRGCEEGQMMIKPGTLLQRKLGENADLYLVSLLYSQMLGMNVDAHDDQRMHSELTAMCRMISSLQKSNGAWETSYEPMLTTVLAWMSLKFAAAAGVTIHQASPHKVVEYLTRECLEEKSGIFREQRWGNNERFVTQSGALRVFYGMDLAHLPAIQRAAKVITRMRFDQDVGGRQGGEEFLGAVFATQALFQDRGDGHAEWYPKIVEALIKCQNRDGSWTGHHCITGRVFCTSCSVLTMLTPDRLLPMVER